MDENRMFIIPGGKKVQEVTGNLNTTPSGTQDVNIVGNTVGLATGGKQDLLLAELQLKADLTETQPVSLASVPSHNVTNAGTFAVQVTSSALPSGAATEATLLTRVSESDFDTKTGALTETAPATDTASSGLNGRLQRIAQRLTSLIALLPASLGQKARTASLAVTLSTEDVSTLTPPAAITNYALENGGNLASIKAKTDNLDVALSTVAKDTTLTTTNTQIGGLTETAPVTDTASSGLNGRLQRIAQRITSLIALFPTALTAGGNFKVAVQEALPVGTNSIGQVTSNAGNANIVIDANNTTTNVLAAGATYTGTVTDISAYAQLLVQIFGRPGVVAGDGSSAKGSFYFELSKDGTNWDTSVPHLIRDPSLVIPIPVIFAHKFFRVKYINDGGVAAIAALGLLDTAGTPTPQTVFRLTTYLLPQATKELTRTLDQGVSGSDPANVVRSVGMGKNPDDTFVNIPTAGVVTVASTSTPLGAGGVYTSSIFPRTGHGSLAISVAVTGTTAVSATDGLQVFHYRDAAGTILGAPPDKFSISTTQAADGGIFVTMAPKAEYVKVVYTNGAVAQTTFQLRTRLSPHATELPRQNIEGNINSSSNATMVRSIQVGRKPDGMYANVQTRGKSSSNNTSSTLLANAVYTGTFENSTPYVSVACLIQADQTSASDGVEIQHSVDGTTVAFVDKYSLVAMDVTNGYAFFTAPVRADFVRIKYTNGGTVQGSFKLNTYLSATALDNIEATIESAFSNSTTAEISRAVITGKNAAGVYANVERGTNGGLDVGIVQHEVDTPIKSLTTGQISQTSVLTSATRLDTSALSGRKCVSVKLLNSAGRKVYLGYSSGVTTGNGYELDAGQAHEMDLSTDKEIWAIADTSSQTVCVNQVG